MEINARIIGRLRDTFCALVKCSCGETRRIYFRPEDPLKPICRRCERDMPVMFGEYDQAKIQRARGWVDGPRQR